LGFETVNLSDVELQKPVPLSLGDYTFQLLPGAETAANKFNGIEELTLSAAVAEGDDSGKRVFWRYPDPTAVSKPKDGSAGKPLTWSAQAMKKLEIALGVDSLPGENPKDYFNRVATSGNARFGASMIPGRNIRQGETEPRPEFGVFTVKPAA
jgi:hypothetical protein